MCRDSVLLILHSESKLQSVFINWKFVKCFGLEDPYYTVPTCLGFPMKKIIDMDKVIKLSEGHELGISQNLRQIFSSPSTHGNYLKDTGLDQLIK